MLRERPQPSATVCSRSWWSAKALPLGEAFGEDFGWKRDVSDSCEVAWKRVEI